MSALSDIESLWLVSQVHFKESQDTDIQLESCVSVQSV